MSAADPLQENRPLRDIIRSVRAGKPTRAKLDELEKRKRRRTEPAEEPEPPQTTAAQSMNQNAAPALQQLQTTQDLGDSVRSVNHETDASKNDNGNSNSKESVNDDSDEVILGTVGDSDTENPQHAHTLATQSTTASSQGKGPKKDEKTPLAGASSAPPPSKQLLDLTAPQVQFINGKIVIDQSSLVLTAEPEVTPIEEYSVVREGSSYLTSHTYSNRPITERWSETETTKFYQHLREFGTDFSMIARVFPNRTRNQLKNKFKREDKENPRLITAALTSRLSTEELLSLVENTIGSSPVYQSTEANAARGFPPQGLESNSNASLAVALPRDSETLHGLPEFQQLQEQQQQHLHLHEGVGSVNEHSGTTNYTTGEPQIPSNQTNQEFSSRSEPISLNEEKITPLEVLQQAASVAAKELEQQTVANPTASTIECKPHESVDTSKNEFPAEVQFPDGISSGRMSPAESLY